MKLFPVSGWRQWLPCSITLMALISGFLSIIFVLQGMVEREAAFLSLGCMFIWIAWIFDSLDGGVARLVKGTSAFGAELDTFVDFLSFSVAPALLVFAVTLPEQPLAIRVLFPTLMAISGGMRLSKFRVMDTERGLKGYTGLPVTLIAGFTAMWTLLLLPDKSLILPGWAQAVLLVTVAAAIILQVSGIHFPAPTKKPLVMLAAVSLFLAFLVLWLAGSPFAKWWGMGIILIGYVYSLIYPFFSKK